jgi:hypothetical protein
MHLEEILRDAFMTLPYKEPSQTLLQLMGVVVQAGQRFASIADHTSRGWESASSSGHDRGFAGKRKQNNVCYSQKNIFFYERGIQIISKRI